MKKSYLIELVKGWFKPMLAAMFQAGKSAHERTDMLLDSCIFILNYQTTGNLKALGINAIKSVLSWSRLLKSNVCELC